tara:strand:+ start:5178 stop:5432 length:255 start_codon:yes stop_codon:yes gene_type:complete
MQIANKYVTDSYVFRVSELAEELRVSSQTIRTWINEGLGDTKLKAINIGSGKKNKTYLIYGFNVNSFLKDRELKPVSTNDYYIK